MTHSIAGEGTDDVDVDEGVSCGAGDAVWLEDGDGERANLEVVKIFLLSDGIVVGDGRIDKLTTKLGMLVRNRNGETESGQGFIYTNRLKNFRDL